MDDFAGAMPRTSGERHIWGGGRHDDTRIRTKDGRTKKDGLGVLNRCDLL